MHETLADTALTPAMRTAIGAKHAIRAVRRRLVRAGSVTELHQLDGLSPCERDLLAIRERTR